MGAARQYQAILGCSLLISSDFAERPQNHAKKIDLTKRIWMHRSRASGASNLLRYGLFCIADWSLFPDWVSSHARLADPIRPMPSKGKSRYSGLPIALISRLPDWVVQFVLPIAIHRLLHRYYPLARPVLPVDFGLFVQLGVVGLASLHVISVVV